MNELNLNPTQLAHLINAVDRIETGYVRRGKCQTSTKFTDLSERELADLKKQINSLKPNPVTV